MFKILCGIESRFFRKLLIKTINIKLKNDKKATKYEYFVNAFKYNMVLILEILSIHVLRKLSGWKVEFQRTMEVKDYINFCNFIDIKRLFQLFFSQFKRFLTFDPIFNKLPKKNYRNERLAKYIALVINLTHK